MVVQEAAARVQLAAQRAEVVGTRVERGDVVGIEKCILPQCGRALKRRRMASTSRKKSQ